MAIMYLPTLPAMAISIFLVIFLVLMLDLIFGA